MAFTATFKSSSTGENVDVYNIDESVGPGAPRGNLPVDVMLVQALFRILHFELDPAVNAPPAGIRSLAVDGKLGTDTARCIAKWQTTARSLGAPILLDGIFDPFRAQHELSHRRHVRYALELLNFACFAQCRMQGKANFTALRDRDDVPEPLRAALAERKAVARKYQSEGAFA